MVSFYSDSENFRQDLLAWQECLRAEKGGEARSLVIKQEEGQERLEVVETPTKRRFSSSLNRKERQKTSDVAKQVFYGSSHEKVKAYFQNKYQVDISQDNLFPSICQFFGQDPLKIDAFLLNSVRAQKLIDQELRGLEETATLSKSEESLLESWTGEISKILASESQSAEDKWFQIAHLIYEQCYYCTHEHNTDKPQNLLFPQDLPIDRRASVLFKLVASLPEKLPFLQQSEQGVLLLFLLECTREFTSSLSYEGKQKYGKIIPHLARIVDTFDTLLAKHLGLPDDFARKIFRYEHRQGVHPIELTENHPVANLVKTCSSSNQNLFEIPEFYEYCGKNSDYAKQLFSSWYVPYYEKKSPILPLKEKLSEALQNSLQLNESELSPWVDKYFPLFLHIGILNYLDEFLEFLSEYFRSHPNLVEVSCLDIINTFSEHLSTSTCYRGMVLTKEEAENIKENGIDSLCYRNGHQGEVTTDLLNPLLPADDMKRHPTQMQMKDLFKSRLEMKNPFLYNRCPFISVTTLKPVARGLGQAESGKTVKEGHIKETDQHLYLFSFEIPRLSILSFHATSKACPTLRLSFPSFAEMGIFTDYDPTRTYLQFYKDQEKGKKIRIDEPGIEKLVFFRIKPEHITDVKLTKRKIRSWKKDAKGGGPFGHYA